MRSDIMQDCSAIYEGFSSRFVVQASWTCAGPKASAFTAPVNHISVLILQKSEFPGIGFADPTSMLGRTR